MSLGTLVIAEDDATLRLMVTTILQKAGFTVLAASDGAEAWSMVQRVRPNLVVSDLQMPKLDGVALLGQIRADAELCTTPVILLTSRSERSQIREGMASGADDYLTKPFFPQDLTEAVMAQLRKHASRSARHTKAVQAAVKSALDNQRHSLATVYERRLRKELSGSLWRNQAPGVGDEVFDDATLLYVDLLSQNWPQLLSPTDLAQMLRIAYSHASDAANLFGAHTVQLLGQGLLAVFVPQDDSASMTHPRRALKSALALLKSSARVQQHLDVHHANLSLPKFELSIALHSGPVTFVQLTDPLQMEKPTVMSVGRAVKSAMFLQRQASQAGIRLLASEAALSTVMSEVQLGRRARMSEHGGETLTIVEVLDWTEPAAPDSVVEPPSDDGLTDIDWASEEGQTVPAPLVLRTERGSTSL